MSVINGGWQHWCRPPGNFGIWLHRIDTAGAQWKCRGCKEVWTLHRRNPTGHMAFWEWHAHEPKRHTPIIK